MINMVYQDAIASSIRRHLSNLQNSGFQKFRFSISPCLSDLCTTVLFCRVRRRPAHPPCSSSSRQQFSNSIVASTMCVCVKVFFFRVKRSKYEVKDMVVKWLYYITSQTGQDWIFSQIVIVPAKVPRRWSRWNLGSVRRAPTFSGSAASESTTSSSWSHVCLHV